MNCPVCKDTKLEISERQGIEIDYCPDCRGVWLDRGELDKIIERTNQNMSSRPDFDPDERSYGKGKYDDDDHHKGYHKKKKKEGFLGELFDF